MSTPDSLSKRGAAFLAAQLDAWWHATGALHVEHWIEPGGVDRTSQGDDDEGRIIFVVRSNLVRGNPPPPERT